ncbi:MAG: [protein-PII] uridylyltransferase [Geothermobacteraceae bacterium]
MTSQTERHRSGRNGCNFDPAPFEPFDSKRDRVLAAARDWLETEREHILKQHRGGASGTSVVASLTWMIDCLLTELFRICLDGVSEADVPCALLAIGGYGRGELNPRSDVDLMFYYQASDRDQVETFSQRLLYLLWDLGLEVGYSVRTRSECLDMAGQDITARTALLDTRFLCGSEQKYRQFDDEVYHQVRDRNTGAFISGKIQERETRVRKYGSSVFLLEPNIKEGEGGLRDLHSALWLFMVRYKCRNMQEMLHKGVLTEEEKQKIEQYLDYLWRIRNELHFLSNRKNDQLHFDKQEEIARFLGYRDNSKAPAVEQFMQDYYLHATQVEHLTSLFFNRVDERERRSVFGHLSRRELEHGFYVLRNELRLAKPDVFKEDPRLLMRTFLLSHRQGVTLSVSLKTAIREHLYLINNAFRRDRQVNRDFFDILRSEGCTPVLRDMHHLCFLNKYIPEFERIYCKVQHDAYHIYTVDIHTLFAVEEMEKLWAGEYAETRPLLTKVANDIEKRELLLLAVLFHDIGKGEGKNHSEKGAILVRTIARRMGLNKEDSARLEFLVLHHLDMAHISQRRDLHDPELIESFARTMEMTETLKMLFLLTFADLKAVGPDVWSEWKGFLLKELYEKTYQVMERGNFTADARSERVRNRKRKVLASLADDYGERKVRNALRKMGNRYLLSHRSHEIAEHLRLALERGRNTVALRVTHLPELKYSQLVVSTLDTPGLFAMITGVLAANGVNILGAQIYTHADGEVVDLLQVASSAGDIIDDARRWQRVEKELAAAIEGRTSVHLAVEKSRRRSFVIEKVRPKYPTRIDFDNRISMNYTVVDIVTHDKVGLLYDISRTFNDMNIYIGVSKISTKVDQVADTFYIQDIFGQKITEPDRLDDIRARLIHAIDGEESGQA